MAYYQMDPFGNERQDRNAAMVACVTANVSGNLKQPQKIEDFMPIFDKPPMQRKTGAEIGAKLMRLFPQSARKAGLHGS